jgi:hypothetical protein
MSADSALEDARERAYVAGIHVLFSLAAPKTWMAPQLGLARVAHHKCRKSGKTRLAVTSPAMTPLLGSM